jgi:uncharacterized protein YkwD
MRCAIGSGKLPLLGAAILTLGCSMVAGSIPAVYRQEAARDLNAFRPPSNTPFLPVRAEATPSAMFPTDSPAAMQTPTETLTIVFILSGTDTPTPTLTLILLPSATRTPVITPYLSPTKSKTRQSADLPTATSKIQKELKLTATRTPLPTPTATKTAARPLTETPTPTEDPRSPTPSDTLTGSETATPTRSATPTPTNTPTASDTPSVTPTPTTTLTPTVTKTPQPSATPTTGPTTSGCATFNFDWEAQVAVMINEERAKNGKYALVMNGKLTTSARAHSVDMVVNKFMSHTGSDGSTPQERERRAGYYGRYWGEIIGGGTPAVAVTWWMNEPGHRDMVLGTNWPYVDYGVGYAYCPGQGWFTVDFGAP